jgi:hypothetical protein
MFRRIGDVADEPHAKTPPCGIQIAAGRHGEHRLIGCIARRDGTSTISISEAPALLVHTDVPSARHGSVLFAPGTWQYWQLQELSVEGVVQEVQD